MKNNVIMFPRVAANEIRVLRLLTRVKLHIANAGFDQRNGKWDSIDRACAWVEVHEAELRFLGKPTKIKKRKT